MSTVFYTYWQPVAEKYKILRTNGKMSNIFALKLQNVTAIKGKQTEK